MGWDISNIRVWYTALKAHNVWKSFSVIYTALGKKNDFLSWDVAEVMEKSCSTSNLIVSLMGYLNDVQRDDPN